MSIGRSACCIEVPPPQDEGSAHSEKRGRACGDTPVLLSFHPVHDGHDRLAQQNEREQPETLGQVRGVGWHCHAVPNCHPWRTQIDGQRNRPNRKPPRRIE
jgi:hypothetical protein